ncbi:MAG: alpha/beta hydrolase [Woeseiaceae bacterium]|nr:alpha/beta hydrolase [Woeseiaceae bacterium]
MTALTLGLAACSPIRLLNATSPSRHYEHTADVPYGAGARQRLDVYVPKQLSGPAPLVVFFYGGGWKEGSKRNYEFVASALTDAGYVVVIPDYRLYPDVAFPAFVDDGAAAVAWAAANADRLGADADNLFVMGHSAGAHIAALLALDERYLASHGYRPSELAGLIGLSGPYDFLPIEGGYLLDVFPEETRARSQPVNFVTAAAAPALLIHGTDDTTVRPTNSDSLAQRLRDVDVPVTLKTYDDVGHARVVAALAPSFDFLSQTLEDSRSFIASVVAERTAHTARTGGSSAVDAAD